VAGADDSLRKLIRIQNSGIFGEDNKKEEKKKTTKKDEKEIPPVM